MKFSDTGLISVLDRWQCASDPRERAQAHNITFEERLERGRLDQFERSLLGPCPDQIELRRLLADFVATNVEVSAPHIPATFQAACEGSRITQIDRTQKLIRVENLTRQLANDGLTLADLETSSLSLDPAVLAKVDAFVDSWNLARDNRPVFAAFKDQLLPEIADARWPERLRDRLGLAHYSARGGTLFVALMQYSVGEILDEAMATPGLSHAFSVPTFLDSKPSAQFFPTPKELPAGAPMALFEIWSDDDLIAEVLHSRLTYRRQHIVKLGEIATDGPAVDFVAMRNNHLAALQVAAERDDFGAEL